MKIFSYLLVSSFFILGTSAFAQSTSENSISKQRKTITEKVDHRVSELTEKLDLTIDQQSKMKAISTTLLEGIKKTKSDSNKTDEEKQNEKGYKSWKMII